jgi:hypothetical protein
MDYRDGKRKAGTDNKNRNAGLGVVTQHELRDSLPGQRSGH